ncbi:MAG: hypothetical protein QOC96_1484 [Acidobacteriota bacterium]|nr:hypothetical protein [Acidobacteriota bacterium]
MRMTTALLAVLSIAVLTTLEAQAQQETKTTGVEIPAQVSRAFRPVIEFGHAGGNLRPYRIGIDANGLVKVLEGSPQLKAEHISAEKVRELVRMANNKKFWESSSADTAEGQKVLPDFGFVFVKVRAAGRRRLIYHHGQATGPLGRFYTQLSDLVMAQP